MRKSFYIFFTIALVSFIIILSGYINHSPNKKNVEAGRIKNNSVQSAPVKTAQKPAVETKADASGPVSSVPWETDSNFKKAQADVGAPIQMAAFRTVLRDPLPGEEFNVHLAASLLKGTVVKPNQVFSQNATIGPYSKDKGFQKGPVYLGPQLSSTIGGGVCKMSSTLYNVAILCDFPVIERHAHGMPVPYVPYGQDATVSYGTKDLKFKNTQSYPILIWAQGVDNILYVAFYGQSQPSQVVWHHQFLQRYIARKIYKYNPSLSEGEQKVVLEGMDGALVQSWVTVGDNGNTKVKQLGRSYYMPMAYIIETKGESRAASQP